MDLPKPGRYRHYKGSEYDVIAVARHSETEEWMVVYRPCYAEADLWVRPALMFQETVTLPSAEVVPRFELLSLAE
ncbi:DUF1653 domain-containing protein [Nitrincola schmidtii]|jgi:hypothetical protein|uniref:DUF1653 domain-containing protein n=1 Tax=Nitrincola schmidtii TaxID=1730894 RepID=UPI00124C84B8|nr:DUF1653 domain-containing protein [Nitrincola schmidtii]